MIITSNHDPRHGFVSQRNEPGSLQFEANLTAIS